MINHIHLIFKHSRFSTLFSPLTNSRGSRHASRVCGLGQMTKCNPSLLSSCSCSSCILITTSLFLYFVARVMQTSPLCQSRWITRRTSSPMVSLKVSCFLHKSLIGSSNDGRGSLNAMCWDMRPKSVNHRGRKRKSEKSKCRMLWQWHTSFVWLVLLLCCTTSKPV